MNKYKNAGGDSNTYVQVKCPVCGYKDITQDKANWTCSECADKKEMKARIITGAKAIQESPVTSVALKKALDTLIEPVKETGLLAEYYRMTGRKPEEPAKVIKEYTVNGLQCKIVSTKRN